MSPPQIIAQLRKLLAAIRADDQLADDARQQQIAGARALAVQLVRAHPKLFMKGSSTPYVAELRGV